MRAYERLMNYVKVHTTSQDGTGRTPTTERQLDLARMLAECGVSILREKEAPEG